MKTLYTPRLVLRGFDEADAADMFAYSSNPKVGPPAGWQPHEDIMESRRIIRSFIQSDEVWAIVHGEQGRVIGSIGMHRDGKRSMEKARMIGYVLAEEWWGQGLMVEGVRAVMRYAFETLGMEILSAYHYPFNTQSKRVIEKCGMRYEGTLRMATRAFSGAIYDDVCYSITRAEWQSTNA